MRAAIRTPSANRPERGSDSTLLKMTSGVGTEVLVPRQVLDVVLSDYDKWTLRQANQV